MPTKEIGQPLCQLKKLVNRCIN